MRTEQSERIPSLAGSALSSVHQETWASLLQGHVVAHGLLLFSARLLCSWSVHQSVLVEAVIPSSVGLCTFLCWTLWDSCLPISSACWGPFEWLKWMNEECDLSIPWVVNENMQEYGPPWGALVVTGIRQDVLPLITTIFSSSASFGMFSVSLCFTV